MHRAGIEWVRAFLDAQEAGALFKCLAAKPGHFEKRLPAGEAAMLLTIADDVLGQHRSDTTDITQQMLACCVKVHAYCVHAADHGLVETLFQSHLVDIMLVLSDADAL